MTFFPFDMYMDHGCRLIGEWHQSPHGDLLLQQISAVSYYIKKHNLAIIGELPKGNRTRYTFCDRLEEMPRIIKIEDSVGVRKRFKGIFCSNAKREHMNHQRVESMGFAASRSLGYVEQYSGMGRSFKLQLRRTVHGQTVVKGMTSLDKLLPNWLHIDPVTTVERLADDLAYQHAHDFFHADLKPYHAYVSQKVLPVQLKLQWIDLARVSFYITPRKRIINIYQLLRFFIPQDLSLQRRFVEHYCQQSGWCVNRSDQVLRYALWFYGRKIRNRTFTALPFPLASKMK